MLQKRHEVLRKIHFVCPAEKSTVTCSWTLVSPLSIGHGVVIYINARKRELLCFPDFTEMETQPMQDFQDLCTFESFRSFWHYYGYGIDQQELLDREFKRIKGK